jgi:signal transduction histidine kinase
LQLENATKDKFFGIIAHDLKNPFSGLIGASELLIDYIDKYDIDNIKKISLLLNDSAKHGYAILENLLEWSRSQTGNIKFNPQHLNIKELVEDIISNMNPFVLQKKIELQSKIFEDIEAVADKEMIRTVLRNLINNSVKFTRARGKIYVFAEKCENSVTITVKDTGTGIPEKDIDKLFRIDIKYTNPGTAQERGTGLGLLLCKEFVEKHNGRIWVESTEGKGSKFKFSIPVKDQNITKKDIKTKITSSV